MKSANGRSISATAVPSAHPKDDPLGARLRGLRQQHGLTLRSLAQKVGVTATALHAWECGRRNPRTEHLQAFADAFKLTKSQLLSGIEEREPQGPFGDSRRAPSATTTERQAQLAEVIAASKQRIATVAGTSPERVRIIIEV